MMQLKLANGGMWTFPEHSDSPSQIAQDEDMLEQGLQSAVYYILRNLVKIKQVRASKIWEGQ